MSEKPDKDLLDENNNLKERINLLENENRDLWFRLAAIENNLKSLKLILVQGEASQFESNLNQLLTANKKESKTETWIEVMDELAHTINTSIMVAANALKEMPESTGQNKAFAHIRQIKNYTELVLWDLYIRRGELLDLNAAPVEVDLLPIFADNISAIKEVPSVLRPKNKNRMAQYNHMKVVCEFPQKCVVLVPEELKNAFNLLFLELLKNSFINSNAEAPIVRVVVKELPKSFEVVFENNKIMEEKYCNWFNGKSDDSSFTMDKVSKVGLRLVMRWTNILKISRQVTLVTEEELTRITLTIPKVIQI